MAKVIVALSKSLDGFIAGPNDGNELPLGAGEPRSSTGTSPATLPAATMSGSGSPSAARRCSMTDSAAPGRSCRAPAPHGRG